MAKARISLTVEAAGVSINSSFERSADQAIGFDPTLPKGKGGSLTTRTNNSDGVITLSTGHGIVQGDIIDLYWAGGLRRGITVSSVATNALTISSGAGDNLPTANTAIVASKITVIAIAFDPDNVPVLALNAKYDATGETSRCLLDFRDSQPASVATFTLVANKARLLDLAGGATDPFDGTAIATCRASNGSVENDCTLQIVGVNDATT